MLHNSSGDHVHMLYAAPLGTVQGAAQAKSQCYCALCAVHCACALCTVHCALCTLLVMLYTVHWTLYSVLPQALVKRPLPDARTEYRAGGGEGLGPSANSGTKMGHAAMAAAAMAMAVAARRSRHMLYATPLSTVQGAAQAKS
jgi:hypothetical protein